MVLRRVEEAFGLPPLREVAEALQKFPDEKKLKHIKEVLVQAERVARIGPDLDKVLALIREINSTPTEKFQYLAAALRSVKGIVTKAPEQLLEILGQGVSPKEE